MKKTITTMTLAIVMTFSASIANAGILLTDRAATNSVGILITDRTNGAAGILITDLCGSESRRGIAVTDIVGTVSSLVGILITDLTGSNEGCGSSRTSKKNSGVTNSSTGILITD